MAFASARVMATCAVGGQAVGTAGGHGRAGGAGPRQLGAHMQELRQTLHKDDCYIPGARNEDPLDLARTAKASASCSLPGCGAGKAAFRRVQARGAGEQLLAAPLEQNPWLRLQLDGPKTVGSCA